MAKQINHWHEWRTKQGRAGHGRIKHRRAGQGRAGQGRTKQGRAGQDKARQGRAGQDRAIRMAMMKTKSMLEKRCKHIFKQAKS